MTFSSLTVSCLDFITFRPHKIVPLYCLKVTLSTLKFDVIPVVYQDNKPEITFLNMFACPELLFPNFGNGVAYQPADCVYENKVFFHVATELLPNICSDILRNPSFTRKFRNALDQEDQYRQTSRVWALGMAPFGMGSQMLECGQVYAIL